MLWLAAVAMTASVPHDWPARPLVEARATVRILSGARLHFKDGHSDDGRPARKTIVSLDGSNRQAQLIEFE
jgi:hypothetical protein